MTVDTMPGEQPRCSRQGSCTPEGTASAAGGNAGAGASAAAPPPARVPAASGMLTLRDGSSPLPAARSPPLPAAVLPLPATRPLPLPAAAPPERPAPLRVGEASTRAYCPRVGVMIGGPPAASLETGDEASAGAALGAPPAGATGERACCSGCLAGLCSGAAPPIGNRPPN